MWTWGRARSALRQWRWPITGAVMLTAAVLGFIGLSHLPAPAQSGKLVTVPVVDRLYYTFMLFRLSVPYAPPYPATLEIARWLAPATVIYAAFRAVASVFAQQWAEFRVRLWSRGHVIVCGLGNYGTRLACAFHDQGTNVVVLCKDATPPGPAGLHECRVRGIPVLAGDATDPLALERAAVRRAACLVAVCGDDGTNADVALAARAALLAPSAAKRAEMQVAGAGPYAGVAPRGLALSALSDPGPRSTSAGRALRCFVQVSDDRLCRLLEESVLAGPVRSSVRFEFFNVVRSGLKALLDEHGSLLLRALPPPHLVVVGPGRAARQLVAEASRRWWVTNGHSGERCRVTLVDPEADESVRILHDRFPALRTACQLEACPADPSDPESPPLALDLLSPPDRCMAYVYFDNDDASAARAAVVVRRALPEEVPVVVATSGRSAVPGLVGGPSSSGLPNVVTFGLLDKVCRPEVLLNGIPEELAQSVHADYVRRRREEHGSAQGPSLADDPALLPWSSLPESLKESNRDQAADIGRKLALVKCHLVPSAGWDAVPREFTPDEVELLARAEHDRWADERKRAGWQWGPVRDVEAKRNPDLVGWEELSERSRDLDRDAVRAIPLFLARLGYAIVPSGHPDKAKPGGADGVAGVNGAVGGGQAAGPAAAPAVPQTPEVPAG